MVGLSVLPVPWFHVRDVSLERWVGFSVHLLWGRAYCHQVTLCIAAVEVNVFLDGQEMV